MVVLMATTLRTPKPRITQATRHMSKSMLGHCGLGHPSSVMTIAHQTTTMSHAQQSL
jgi:hypothetical protein